MPSHATEHSQEHRTSLRTLKRLTLGVYVLFSTHHTFSLSMANTSFSFSATGCSLLGSFWSLATGSFFSFAGDLDLDLLSLGRRSMRSDILLQSSHTSRNFQFTFQNLHISIFHFPDLRTFGQGRQSPRCAAVSRTTPTNAVIID